MQFASLHSSLNSWKYSHNFLSCLIGLLAAWVLAIFFLAFLYFYLFALCSLLHRLLPTLGTSIVAPLLSRLLVFCFLSYKLSWSVILCFPPFLFRSIVVSCFFLFSARILENCLAPLLLSCFLCSILLVCFVASIVADILLFWFVGFLLFTCTHSYMLLACFLAFLFMHSFH